MTNRKLVWFKIAQQAGGSPRWRINDSFSARVFWGMRTIQFPQSFHSRLELNPTSKIIIKTSTRRRRSVDFDWSADFLWSGGDNLFDLSWLHLILPILKVNLYSSAKQCMEGFYCFLALPLLSWLSPSNSSCLSFFVRKELPPWPKQALNIFELFADIWKRTMCSFFLSSALVSLERGSDRRATIHISRSTLIFALVLKKKKKMSLSCGGALGFSAGISSPFLSVGQRKVKLGEVKQHPGNGCVYKRSSSPRIERVETQLSWSTWPLWRFTGRKNFTWWMCTVVVHWEREKKKVNWKKVRQSWLSQSSTYICFIFFLY